MVLGGRVFELRIEVEAIGIPSLPEGFTPMSDSDVAMMLAVGARGVRA